MSSSGLGDLIGSAVQKGELRKALDGLVRSEAALKVQLDGLLARYFPAVDEETWEAARSVGVESSLTLDALNLLAALATVGSRSGMVIASRVGFTISTHVFSVLGAVVSTGDFVHTMLTKHPNRKGLESVLAILEGKDQSAKVWQVLFTQWLTLPDIGELTEEQIRSREKQLDYGIQSLFQTGVGDEDERVRQFRL